MRFIKLLHYKKVFIILVATAFLSGCIHGLILCHEDDGQISVEYLNDTCCDSLCGNFHRSTSPVNTAISIQQKDFASCDDTLIPVIAHNNSDTFTDFGFNSTIFRDECNSDIDVDVINIHQYNFLVHSGDCLELSLKTTILLI